MSAKTLKAADLFCGAGGTSTGLLRACAALGYKVELTAVNHWERAISTHTANHPEARHLQTSIDDVNPRSLFAEGELDLLWASPECTHHSVARGGKPINDQSRATAWCVTRWAEALRPAIILVENVPEFENWGGIGADGRPLASKRGATFLAWVATLESLGYRVGHRVLCAADFGDPTTRRRLFVQAVRGKRRVVFPNPICGPVKREGDLFGELRPWATAKDHVIDWSLSAPSIYERKKPLSPKTMNRIWEGLKKFGMKSFIVPNFGEREGQRARTNSVSEPLPTVTGHGAGGLVEPFIMSAGGPECGARPVSEPVGTILTRDHRALVEPFLVTMEHAGGVRSADRPMPTITTAKGGAIGLVEPFIVGAGGSEYASKPRSVEAPLSTVVCDDHKALVQPFLVELRGTSEEAINGSARSLEQPVSAVATSGAHHGLVEPYLVQVAHGSGGDAGADARRSKPTNEPLATVCGNRGEWALCEPGLLPQQSGGELRPVSEPVPTVATGGAIGLVEPFLVSYYGTGNAASVNEPMETITTKDRFGLVRPEVIVNGERFLLDIRFRMLQPHELAKAQGFPDGYVFTGTKTEQVKQIGNAVPGGLAEALALAVITQNADVAELMRPSN